MENNPLNNYAVKMAEIQLSRNPVATEVIVIFNDVNRWDPDLEAPNPEEVITLDRTLRDHYQDAPNSMDRGLREEVRFKKWATVKKDPNMHYIQFDLTDQLMEEPESNPWLVSMTILGLPRLPKTDDRLLIQGKLYTISQVKPSNRNLDGIINLMIYPEHTDEDTLYIRCEKFNDYSLSFIWGGVPVEYSTDGTTYLPFRSYVPLPSAPCTITVRDSLGNTATCTYDL